MPLYIDGPILLLNQAFQYNLRNAIPADHAVQDVIGVMFHNDTPWEIYTTGYNQSVLRLRPYAELYVPNTLGMQLPTVVNFTPSQNTVFSLTKFKLTAATVNFSLFFEGEEEPSNRYINDFQAIVAAPAGPTGLQPVNFLAFIASVSSSTAHNIVLQASLQDLTAQLILTHASWFFGVPNTAVSSDMQITDNNGFQWLSVHLNLGIAPMPPFKDICNFPYPPATFPPNGIPPQIASFTLAVPAIASGPNYSATLQGYTR